MLYALEHPASLLVLLTSFVLGVTLHGWVQSLVASRLGDQRPRYEGRHVPDPRRHLDPFGCVAAAISGLGWAKPLEAPGRLSKGRLVALCLSGPLVNLLLGVGLLVAAGAVLPFALTEAATLLQRGTPLGDEALGLSLLLAGASQLYLGALSLVPLPPLPGGRLLLGLAPRSLGWQKAEHLLVEQNVGLVALLVLLVLPLGGPLPLLPQLLDTVLGPLVQVLTGG